MGAPLCPVLCFPVSADCAVLALLGLSAFPPQSFFAQGSAAQPSASPHGQNVSVDFSMRFPHGKPSIRVRPAGFSLQITTCWGVQQKPREMVQAWRGMAAAEPT